MHGKLKDIFKQANDEYKSLNINSSNDTLDTFNLTKIDMAKYPIIKDQISQLLIELNKLLNSVNKILAAHKSLVIDTLDFGKQFQLILNQNSLNCDLNYNSHQIGDINSIDTIFRDSKNGNTSPGIMNKSGYKNTDSNSSTSNSGLSGNKNP